VLAGSATVVNSATFDASANRKIFRVTLRCDPPSETL